MLMRDIAPWLGLLALLGGAGLQAADFIDASRWAATVLWCGAVLGFIAAWQRERRGTADRRGLDRLFIAAAVMVVALAVLSI